MPEMPESEHSVSQIEAIAVRVSAVASRLEMISATMRERDITIVVARYYKSANAGMRSLENFTQSLHLDMVDKIGEQK